MMTMPLGPTPGSPHPLDDVRWNAVATRTPLANGASFVFAVATTGVYCRPGCASRLPRRDNVRFFETPAAAEAARFRACKRCAPNVAHDAAWPAVERALEAIDASDEVPPLADLSALAGFSRAQFHRTFVRLLGLTPKRYAALGRAERLRARLQAGERESLLEASLAAGYSSPQAARAGGALLGMTPRALRSGGRGERVRVGSGSTSLGFVVAAMTARGICAVELDDDEAAARERIVRRYPSAEFGASPELDAVLAELVRAIERPGAPLRVPLDVAGTAFQRRVWDELARIASGTTITYGELAERVGAPRSARAVAGACASNAVALVIPCHRVVPRDGGAGGYRWGAERKRDLLDRERLT